MKMGYIYFIRMCGKNLFKIGLTRQKPEMRLYEVESEVRARLGNKKIKLKLYGFFESDNLMRDEDDLHSFFSVSHVSLFGKDEEWFSLDCDTVDQTLRECKTPDSLSIIDKLQTSETYISNFEYGVNNPESNFCYSKDLYAGLNLFCAKAKLIELKKKRKKKLAEWKRKNFTETVAEKLC